jgi:hypothetical protein
MLNKNINKKKYAGSKLNFYSENPDSTLSPLRRPSQSRALAGPARIPSTIISPSSVRPEQSIRPSADRTPDNTVKIEGCPAILEDSYPTSYSTFT